MNDENTEFSPSFVMRKYWTWMIMLVYHVVGASNIVHFKNSKVLSPYLHSFEIFAKHKDMPKSYAVACFERFMNFRILHVWRGVGFWSYEKYKKKKLPFGLKHLFFIFCKLASYDACRSIRRFSALARRDGEEVSLSPASCLKILFLIIANKNYQVSGQYPEVHLIIFPLPTVGICKLLKAGPFQHQTHLQVL